MVSTLAHIHPKGTVPLSLSDKLGEASTCTQVTSHEQRPYSTWISERRLCSQHLLLSYYTSLLWTGHSHVNQARDQWDENDDRRGYQRCREQRLLDRRPLRSHLQSRKHPQWTPSFSPLAKSQGWQVLSVWVLWEHSRTQPSRDRPRLLPGHNSRAAGMTGTPSSPRAKVFTAWSFAKLVDLCARVETLRLKSHTTLFLFFFFNLFPTSQQKF